MLVFQSLYVYGLPPGPSRSTMTGTLLLGAIRRNLTTAANVFYRFGPNVMGSFEVSQTRTAYVWIGNRLNNHYDLALGYLF